MTAARIIAALTVIAGFCCAFRITGGAFFVAFGALSLLAGFISFGLSLKLLDEAVVMLGMLAIVFRLHPIAGRFRVAGHISVFLINRRRRAANFYIRPVAVERAIGIIVVPVIVIIAAVIPSPLALHSVSCGQCAARLRRAFARLNAKKIRSILPLFFGLSVLGDKAPGASQFLK